MERVQSITCELTDDDELEGFRVTIECERGTFVFQLLAGELVQVVNIMHGALLRWLRVGVAELDDVPLDDELRDYLRGRVPGEPPNTVILVPRP